MRSDTRLLEIVGQERILPEGIEILGENLFLVPWELLELGDENNFDWDEVCGEEEKTALRGFVNPRRYDGNGFEQKTMFELYTDIKEEGLHSNLICRWIIKDDGSIAVQILDGERRYNNIRQLRIKNELCRAPDRKLQPATKVYAKVVCKCENRTDDEALKIAIGCSERHVHWGEGATAKLIWQLQTKYRMSNEEILALTKKSEQWLREQDQICRLRSSGDLKTFEYLCTEKINRALCLQLAKIPDIDERHRWLDKCYQNAVDHHAEEVAKAQTALKRAEDKEEKAEGQLAIVEHLGTPEQIEEAKQQLEEARDKVTEKQNERAAASKPRARTSNLRNVAGEEQEQTGGKSAVSVPLRHNKIESCHLKPVQDLLESKGLLPTGKILFTADELPILRYLEASMKAAITGIEDIVGVLRRTKDTLKIEADRQKRK